MTHQRDARIMETRALLESLGFDTPRANERSALVLLALLELEPRQAWTEANGAGTYRTVDLMDWIARVYAKGYKPNTREVIRRQTLHQFVDQGLVLYNPDDPGRPTNSGKNCYQISPEALALLRTSDEPGFDGRAAEYLAERPSLLTKYAMARAMEHVPVQLTDGRSVSLSPGGQNILIKEMIEEFCPRFTPGGTVLYIGDTGRDDPVFDRKALAALGVELDTHGKMPDLIVHMAGRDWLVLLEAASTHGPVDAKRRGELQALFASCDAGLVYVSCFPTRAEMRKYLAEIAWETEGWCADAPDHMIHFNGERFLGPYE